MSDNSFIIINKPTDTTTKELYHNTYSKQTLEILKLVVGFLLASLLLNIINIGILDKYASNNLLQLFITIILTISIYFIAIELFTYIKIQSDKELLLKELTK